MSVMRIEMWAKVETRRLNLPESQVVVAASIGWRLTITT